MTRKHSSFLGLTVAAAIAGAGVAAAWAADQYAPEEAVSSFKISLADATHTAEAHEHGNAFKAEAEHDPNGWVYDVEVKSEKGVSEVVVDAMSGLVIRVETGDDEDGHDKDD